MFKLVQSRFNILLQFGKYLAKRGKILLLLTLIFLVIFGALLLVVHSQVAPSPFIYTLF